MLKIVGKIGNFMDYVSPTESVSEQKIQAVSGEDPNDPLTVPRRPPSSASRGTSGDGMRGEYRGRGGRGSSHGHRGGHHRGRGRGDAGHSHCHQKEQP